MLVSDRWRVKQIGRDDPAFTDWWLWCRQSGVRNNKNGSIVCLRLLFIEHRRPATKHHLGSGQGGFLLNHTPTVITVVVNMSVEVRFYQPFLLPIVIGNCEVQECPIPE